MEAPRAIHVAEELFWLLAEADDLQGAIDLLTLLDDDRSDPDALATTLKKSGEFPTTMIDMVAVGEEAGKLEQMLDRVATTYESEVDTKLSRFTALLEPMMLVLMGGAVAFIVFSILQPIMDLGNLSGPK